jgi:hypothetical protein
MELQSVVKELEGFHGVLKTDIELTLKTTMETLNWNLKKKSTLMRHLMDNITHLFVLHPSRFLHEGK